MKRAVLNIQMSAHELLGQELREGIPSSVIEDNGLKLSTIVTFDAEDEFHLFKKIREWLELAS